MKFSANLGFLWSDRPLPDAIRAAKAAGFDAVECHWPYEVAAEEVKTALAESGLPMLGLNTIRGLPGENGLSALPDRKPGRPASAYKSSSCCTNEAKREGVFSARMSRHRITASWMPQRLSSVMSSSMR